MVSYKLSISAIGLFLRLGMVIQDLKFSKQFSKRIVNTISQTINSFAKVLLFLNTHDYPEDIEYVKAFEAMSQDKRTTHNPYKITRF